MSAEPLPHNAEAGLDDNLTTGAPPATPTRSTTRPDRARPDDSAPGGAGDDGGRGRLPTDARRDTARPHHGPAAPEADRRFTVEDMEDAELEGDRPIRSGTAAAALRYSGFRRVFAGSVASNIGSWMQNVVLTAYAYSLTRSASFVAVMGFAQLGPLLFVSLIGGSLADRFDRKKLLVIVSVQQAACAFALALVATNPDPSRAALVAIVFAIGMGQAVAGPTFASVLPSLVQPRDLPGAVSLTSANMNLSRMIGAALGPLVYARWGVPWVFAANAATYFFIIAGVATVDIPRPQITPGGPTGLRRILGGFTVAAKDRTIGRVLITLSVFSFFSLVFVVQMPTIANANLGISEKSFAYGLLYGTFAFGAMIGALSVGTFLAGRDLEKLVRVGLLGFAAMLTTFALWRHPGPAYPTVFILGFFYFMVITSLSTVLQSRLDNNNRGRVMAIWIMAFGGTVPIGNLVAGPIIDATTITDVMLFGALVAVALIFYARFDTGPLTGAAATDHTATETSGLAGSRAESRGPATS